MTVWLSPVSICIKLLTLASIAPIVIKNIDTIIEIVIYFFTPKNFVIVSTKRTRVLLKVKNIGIGIKERALLVIPILIK